MNILLSSEPGLDVLIGFFRSAGASFRNFGFRDALDILFLTLMFLFLFRFLRGRKAGALLIGIGICLLISFLSYVFELQGVYWIISSVSRYGALAIIILFQPEIREALEKVGSGSIGSIFPRSEQKRQRKLYMDAIQNICSAVSDLAQEKTGALIVVERTTKLDDIVDSGITINADVNAFLLRNLFFNKAPLHDGAVVIKDARVTAAGCLLPLTRRPDVDSNLGTRHRAAIGMAETSDAIVIVVSEETGIISVAYDCELERNYTVETLRRFLTQKLLRAHIDAEK